LATIKHQTQLKTTYYIRQKQNDYVIKYIGRMIQLLAATVLLQ